MSQESVDEMNKNIKKSAGMELFTKYMNRLGQHPDVFHNTAKDPGYPTKRNLTQDVMSTSVFVFLFAFFRSVNSQLTTSFGESTVCNLEF